MVATYSAGLCRAFFAHRGAAVPPAVARPPRPGNAVALPGLLHAVGSQRRRLERLAPFWVVGDLFLAGEARLCAQREPRRRVWRTAVFVGWGVGRWGGGVCGWACLRRGTCAACARRRRRALLAPAASFSTGADGRHTARAGLSALLPECNSTGAVPRPRGLRSCLGPACLRCVPPPGLELPASLSRARAAHAAGGGATAWAGGGRCLLRKGAELGQVLLPARGGNPSRCLGRPGLQPLVSGEGRERQAAEVGGYRSKGGGLTQLPPSRLGFLVRS